MRWKPFVTVALGLAVLVGCSSKESRSKTVKVKASSEQQNLEDKHQPFFSTANLAPHPSGLGIVVTEIAPGSQWEKVGFQESDHLVTIDEDPIQPEQVYLLRKALEKPELHAITVHRWMDGYKCPISHQLGKSHDELPIEARFRCVELPSKNSAGTS